MLSEKEQNAAMFDEGKRTNNLEGVPLTNHWVGAVAKAQEKATTKEIFKDFEKYMCEVIDADPKQLNGAFLKKAHPDQAVRAEPQSSKKVFPGKNP